jgi:CRISPR/Cas system CSM-associated protein Csm3 (group 7 of RAMP superfamily)
MRRLEIEFRIHWESPWHVGSGFASAEVDRLIRRRGGRHGRPFVPGSQLKGVLRHQAERIAATLGCAVSDPHADDVAHFGPLARSPLIVDRLFGSRYQGECLYVDDALPVAGLRPAVRDHMVVTRTALDRVTGTVRERRLFSSEVAVGDGLILGSRLRAVHPGGVLLVDEDGLPLEYVLLVAALLGIESLGGQKSAGHGRCRVSIPGEAVSVDGTTRPVADVLSGLASGDWGILRELLEEERFGT